MLDEIKLKLIYDKINQGYKITEALRSSGLNNKFLFEFRRSKQYYEIYKYYQKLKNKN